MLRSRHEGANIAKIVAGVVFGLAVIVVIALLIGRYSSPQNESGKEVDGSVAGVEPTEPAFPSSAIETAPAPSPKKHSDRGELTPGEVIDKLGQQECSMERGSGSAADLAIVTVSERNINEAKLSTRFSTWHSTRFSILDQTGALHSGELPFRPFQLKLGRQPHGPTVAGFGGINLQPSHTGLPAEGEPLQIFMDDAMVYEKDNVWLFDVATDGSSYFFIESLGSDLSSQLTISNLNQGTEVSHNLGTMLSSPDGALAYLASYTPDNEEVHLQPISEYTKGIGVHHFFKVQGEGPPRKIRILDRGDKGLNDQAHFVSSEEGYIFYQPANGAAGFHIVKARFDWPPGISISAWRKDGPVGVAAGAAKTSPDGAWLLFGTGTANTANRPSRPGDRMIYVLDAATGETVFTLPTDDPDAQMRQLSSVLSPQATEDDVGWLYGVFFLGNDKLVVERLKDSSDRETAKFYDVYDMNSISLDAQPEYRVEGNQHRWNPCASKGFPGTLQVAENGRLAYAGLQ